MVGSMFSSDNIVKKSLVIPLAPTHHFPLLFETLLTEVLGQRALWVGASGTPSRRALLVHPLRSPVGGLGLQQLLEQLALGSGLPTH